MLRVIEDVYVQDNNWRYDFIDGSSVIVKEVLSASPPHLVKVSGEFTAEQVAGIQHYSALELK